MENILLLDTAVASFNKGDDIIMECIRKELKFLMDNNFEINVPTHVSSFHWYQIFRGLSRIHRYEQCRYKFVGGTNLLVKDMLTWYPLWDVNIFNSAPLKGCILMGVGAGAGNKTNAYTRMLYRKLLSHDYIHSVRDERSKEFVESLGLKAINTGCATMWMLTPEFCQTIPTSKADAVIFTLTASNRPDPRDQVLIDTLRRNYRQVSYWVQGVDDFRYLQQFRNIEGITIIPATKDAFDRALSVPEQVDYIGTRLHGGVYAMRHGRRAIIIAIDERAREINKSNNLNCIEKEQLEELEAMLNSEFATSIRMPFDRIELWKQQFCS